MAPQISNQIDAADGETMLPWWDHVTMVRPCYYDDHVSMRNCVSVSVSRYRTCCVL